MEVEDKAALPQMTFSMTGEDHTLGNVLRAVLAGQPTVEFVGYSIPHPTSDQLNLRLQTLGGRPAVEVLVNGFDDIIGICDILRKAWRNAVATYQAENPLGADNHDDGEDEADMVRG